MIDAAGARGHRRDYRSQHVLSCRGLLILLPLIGLDTEVGSSCQQITVRPYLQNIARGVRLAAPAEVGPP